MVTSHVSVGLTLGDDMQKKIYVVKDRDSGKKVLVKALNRQAARNAATRRAFEVELASQEELVVLVQQGAAIIDDATETNEGEG